MMQKRTGEASLRGARTEAQRQAAAAVMGSARTEAKAASSRANGRLAPAGPGRTPKPLDAYECTCGRGMSLDGHPTTCPRGVVIWRRRRKGQL